MKLCVVPAEAGVDESGCGSLIGDLVAAAVVLPDDFDTSRVNDSKKLTPATRASIYDAIMATNQVGVGIVTLAEIHTNTFSWARRTVFQRALENLPVVPHTIVVDGPHFFDGFRDIPYQCIAKADSLYASVAAASIVAKVTRDRMIHAICAEHPEYAQRYKWNTNMGYSTAAHREGLQAHGVTEYHRPFQLFRKA